MLTRERNWAGNYTYTASTIHHPRSIDELRELVARAPRIHALGSRHCFNDIADSSELVSLEALAGELEIDRDASTVTVSGGMRYGDLARALVQDGLALHNMASLPHISIAGSIATATHGSGDSNGNLATAVSALELVTSDGEVITAARGDDDFAGMVVNLGALGVVTRVTLDVEPNYLVRQEVFEHLSWDVFYERFDEVMSSTYSVSIFHDFGETVGSVWMKSRVDPENPAPLRGEFLGARAATRHRHPMETMTGENCTEQLGVPGLWADRLPHFRLDATPASGDEIQAEYMVPRQFAIPALEALCARASEIRPHLLISEVRTVAADNLWLSTAYGTETVGLHFSWKPDQAGVDEVLPVVEEALAPFQPRPHWGKEFRMGAGELEARYPKLAEFRRLAERLDPRGAFRNPFLERTLFG